MCDYGRIGQNVGHLLEEEKIPFLALDLDPARVREAHLAGEPVFYGDSADPNVLETIGLAHARRRACGPVARHGRAEVVPKSLEARLMIAAHALLLKVPLARVLRRMQQQRASRYLLLREFFRSESLSLEESPPRDADRLRPVVVAPDSAAIGKTLGEFDLNGVIVTALVRQGRRELTPPPETRLHAGDVLVLSGAPDDLDRAEKTLLG